MAGMDVQLHGVQIKNEGPLCFDELGRGARVVVVGGLLARRRASNGTLAPCSGVLMGSTHVLCFPQNPVRLPL